LETIPSNVSSQQLVRVVVRQSGGGAVGSSTGGGASLPQAQFPQMAPQMDMADGITLTQYEVPVRETPLGIPAQPVELMAYEYQIPTLPARNAVSKGELESASEVFVNEDVEAASGVMLNF
jgi:hypothetical protein